MRCNALPAVVLGLALASGPAATFTVTVTDDSGPGSLRQAILDANALPGDDTITFATNGTITLASPLPAVSDNTAIIGPGTNQLTISGNNTVQVFSLKAGTTNTLSGLTIANGLATAYANGAGIVNAGTLTLLNCALLNNTNQGGWGGAIFNSGNLAVTNSVLSGNLAAGESGSGSASGTGGGGGAAGMGEDSIIHPELLFFQVAYFLETKPRAQPEVVQAEPAAEAESTEGAQDPPRIAIQLETEAPAVTEVEQAAAVTD